MGAIPLIMASTVDTKSAQDKRFDEARVLVFGDAGLIINSKWGDEVIRNPDIAFASLEVPGVRTGSRLSATREIRDMLLGVDFLRAHRVFVAHSQRKFYFTYTGGPVFSAPPKPAAK